MPPPPPSLSAIAQRVDDRLRSLLDAEQQRWIAVDPGLRAPLDSIRSLVLGGGKRLRPAFCHWGFVAAGGDPDDPWIVAAGAAFELLHAFALVHDDVMDGSATRRGQRTTHLEFGDRHAEGNWTGEARRFGEGVAILVGDLTFVYADMMLRGAPEVAIDIWNELRIEVNVGQYLDLLGTARRERDRASTERIGRYKSGKYTVERPLHLGAALAAPARLHQLMAPLSAYGLPLGTAFQLRDDVLGVFGDAAVVGKPVGDDLREGKPTPLLAIATRRATASQSALLARVGSPDLSDREVADLQQLMTDCGALAELEYEIKRLTDEAIAGIENAGVVDDARDHLIELAHFVAFRDS
jgi:geranylgeranyl diphosphate synthase type I